MNRMNSNLLGICLLLASSISVVYAQSIKSADTSATRKTASASHKGDSSLTEEFSFWIKDFKVDHQALTNNVNISVSFRYVPGIKNSEYPDFRWLTKDVESFLTNYPNEEDYWEIVNKQLTAQLMKKYPVLSSITIELKLDPSTPSPYVRSSRVSRERAR